MKYELVAMLLVIGSAFGGLTQDSVVAVDPDTLVAEDVGGDVVHHWGVDETTQDEEWDGNGDIIVQPDDEWEAGLPYGNPWDPNEDSTREGSDLGGNPDVNQDFIHPELGDEIVTGPVMEVFEGRDVKESLATEHGRGGGARGHARGRGRQNPNTRRNLRANKQN